MRGRTLRMPVVPKRLAERMVDEMAQHVTSPQARRIRRTPTLRIYLSSDVRSSIVMLPTPAWIRTEMTPPFYRDCTEDAAHRQMRSTNAWITGPI